MQVSTNFWVYADSCGLKTSFLGNGRKECGHDLKLEIFIVAIAVGASLQNTDFVVDPFNQAETDFVLRMTVGGNSIPVGLNHFGELLVRIAGAAI